MEEERLLLEKRSSDEGAFVGQLKRVSVIAGPMVVVAVSQFLLRAVSLMIVGHLGGQLSLAGVSLATSFANVTGFSILRFLVTFFSLNTTSLHYFIPYAVGASASTRVSNELGAGNPKAAKSSVRVVVILGIVEAVIVSILFICYRHILGYAYSNDKEVIDYVADMVPLLCVSVSVDSLIGALSGIARGGGFQQLGAYVNLGAYYLVAGPIALLFGFGLKLNAKGLWMGTLTGSILQVIILAVVTMLTDWQKEATKARERIVEKSIKAANGLV